MLKIQRALLCKNLSDVIRINVKTDGGIITKGILEFGEKTKLYADQRNTEMGQMRNKGIKEVRGELILYLSYCAQIQTSIMDVVSNFLTMLLQKKIIQGQFFLIGPIS